MKINLVTLKNNLELFILIQVSQVLNLLGYNIYQAMQCNHLPAHTIDSDTHVARMLSHHKAIVFIQIKHGIFGCKVHKQKRHVKVGLFRMVTPGQPARRHST